MQLNKYPLNVINKLIKGTLKINNSEHTKKKWNRYKSSSYTRKVLLKI